MKFFGFLLFLVLAALMASAVVVAEEEEEDPAVEACRQNCVNVPDNPVCGTGKATYRNECVMKCENAELIHQGKCENSDLMENKGIIN